MLDASLCHSSGISVISDLIRQGLSACLCINDVFKNLYEVFFRDLNLFC